jgi:hypothetical protein
MSRPIRSPIERALIGTAASVLLLMLWKIVDAPLGRALTRKMSPEMLWYMDTLVSWVIPVAIVLPSILLSWKAFSMVRQST